MHHRRRPLPPRDLAAGLSRLAAAALALAMVLAGCRSAAPLPPPPPSATPAAVLRLGVAGGAEPLAAIAGRYGEETGNAQMLQFIAGSDDRLLDQIAGGYLDAAFAYYLPPGRDLWFTPVAVDGVVALVHPDNPVANLSMEQLRAAFAGRITNWSQMGGPDVAVEVVVREEGSGLRDWFAGRVMAGQALAPTAIVAATDAAVANAVATRPGGLGLSALGASDGRPAMLVDGIQPAPQTAASQQYPLSLPIYLVAPEEPHGPLRALLSWLQSAAGQRLLGENYGRVS